MDCKSEIEGSFDHRFVAIVHLPGLCSSFRNYLDNGIRIEACTSSETETFGQTLDNPARQI